MKKVGLIALLCSLGISEAVAKVDTYAGSAGAYIDMFGEQTVLNSTKDISGASALSILSLDGKQLTSVNGFDRLQNPRNIKEIRLNGNLIGDDDPWLTKQPFRIFPNLVRIYMDNNRLTTLPVDIFQGLKQLKEIYLHTNQITSLPAGIFDNLPSLTRVEVYGNKLPGTATDFKNTYLTNYPNVVLAFDPQKK